MLNEYQKLTARVAVGKAIDKDAEIKKLAANMKVPEKEIRTYWESVSGMAPAVAESPKTAHAPKPQGSKKSRIFWTDDMLRQLDELHNLGNTAPQIAKVMGLDVKQVINKLHRKPDPRAASPSPPAEPSSEPKSDKPIVSEVETPQAPKLCPTDLPQELVEPAPIPSTPPEVTAERRDIIDMPKALFLITELVHKQFSDNVVRMNADNDEHRSVCTFEVAGVEYSLALEVLKWNC